MICYETQHCVHTTTLYGTLAINYNDDMIATNTWHKKMGDLWHDSLWCTYSDRGDKWERWCKRAYT